MYKAYSKGKVVESSHHSNSSRALEEEIVRFDDHSPRISIAEFHTREREREKERERESVCGVIFFFQRL